MSNINQPVPVNTHPLLSIDFKFFYVSEIAAMLRVSSMTIYALLHEGKLSGIKIGRSWKIPESAVLDYVRSLHT